MRLGLSFRGVGLVSGWGLGLFELSYVLGWGRSSGARLGGGGNPIFREGWPGDWKEDIHIHTHVHSPVEKQLKPCRLKL